MKKIFTLLLCTLPYLVIAQNYSLLLKSGTITPEAGIIQPADNNEIVNGRYYRLIQFNEIPGNDEKALLEKTGISLYNYLPYNTYMASIPATSGAAGIVAANKNIRAVSELKAAYKLDEYLTKRQYPDHAVSGNGNVQLLVSHQPDVPNALVSEMLQNAGAEILYNMPVTGQHGIIIHKDQVNTIAALPFIYFLEVAEGDPKADNLPGRTSHRSNTINTEYKTGLKYDGRGVSIALNDDGIIGPHIDYTGRLKAQFMTNNSGDHGDHCAGTIFGGGNLNPTTSGMAPGADLYAYRVGGGSPLGYQGFDSIYNHYASKEIRITSTSYSNGLNSGYTSLARTMDRQTRDLQDLMHVFSAGNDGTEDTGPAGPNWANITGGHKQAKNVITTGNLTFDDNLNTSSSRGPAKDGRIKPDICAVGTSVYSTIDTNKYVNKTGTSMSCPGMAGVTAQLYQAYKEMNSGLYPHSALIKAIMLNTCDDLGNAGPDFKFGWGRVNARRALATLQEHRYIKDSVNQGASKTHEINVPANTAELRVMVYWNDYEATANAAKALINDIDINITTPTTTNVSPWVLDHTLDATILNTPAIRGTDHLNNMEQVTISNPDQGTYTVNVSGFQIPQGPQRYYLVYELVTNDIVVTYPIGGESFVPGTSETIRWDAYGDLGTFALQYSTDNGNNWSNIFNSISGTVRHYNWTPPNTVTGQALVKVIRNATSDQSDAAFSIIGVPTGLSVSWVCEDSIQVAYNAVPNATGYIVTILGDKYMDSVASSTTTTCVVRNIKNTNGGWFSVQATGPNGCQGRRALAKIYQAGSPCPAGPADVAYLDNSGWNIEIYPNPVEDKFHVKLSGIQESVHITIADVKGKLIHQQVTTGNNNITIDMKNTPAGIYFISVAGKQGVIKKKLIKM